MQGYGRPVDQHPATEPATAAIPSQSLINLRSRLLRSAVPNFSTKQSYVYEGVD